MNKKQVEIRLEQMRKGVLSRQVRLAAHVEHRQVPLPADFHDQAVELGNDEAMVQLNHQMKTDLVDIQHALNRLRDGTYQTCSVCHGEIEAPRLVALPTTIFCATCAQDESGNPSQI